MNPDETAALAELEPDRAELARLTKRRAARERRDRWRAARVLINNRLVAPLAEPWHGKAWVYDDYCCRCWLCTQAKYEQLVAWRAARRARSQQGQPT